MQYHTNLQTELQLTLFLQSTEYAKYQASCFVYSGSNPMSKFYEYVIGKQGDQ